MVKPLVSILIPAYNSERWVGDSIRSALAQTWPNTEIIVVDDGSTDSTLAAAQPFASSSVKVLTQKNQGAAVARNTAFAAAQGDYIQWLDADDLLSPDKITLQMNALGAHGSPRTLLSSEWGAFIYRPRRANFEVTALWQDLDPVEWLVRKLKDNLSMQTATWLVSRELTVAAGPWDTRLLADDDGEYFARVVAQSDGIRFVPGARLYYRRAEPSLSYIGDSARKLEAQCLTMELYVRHIRALEDSPRVREACISLLNQSRMVFYPERMDLYARIENAATELGGHLEAPEVSWKYSFLKTCFGWSTAKRAQMHYNRFKTSLFRAWDGFLYGVEERIGGF